MWLLKFRDSNGRVSDICFSQANEISYPSKPSTCAISIREQDPNFIIYYSPFMSATITILPTWPTKISCGFCWPLLASCLVHIEANCNRNRCNTHDENGNSSTALFIIHQLVCWGRQTDSWRKASPICEEGFLRREGCFYSSRQG